MGGKLGLPEILLILAIALLIFGPSKLANLGKGLGEGIKNFKSAVKDGEEEKDKKQGGSRTATHSAGHFQRDHAARCPRGFRAPA